MISCLMSACTQMLVVTTYVIVLDALPQSHNEDLLHVLGHLAVDSDPLEGLVSDRLIRCLQQLDDRWENLCVMDLQIWFVIVN